MNANEFAKSIDQLYERLKALTASKGEEYKRREDNQFANFERGAQALGLTREQVLMVYLSKHMDSITTYVKDRAAGQERVYSEPITGRIDDAILYLLLLRGMAVENEGVARAIETQATVGIGGVTTPRRTAGVGAPVVVASTSQSAAQQECRSRGLPVGTAAIMYPDQLHGYKSGTHVVYVHLPGSTESVIMLGQFRARAEKQGLSFEVVERQLEGAGLAGAAPAEREGGPQA